MDVYIRTVSSRNYPISIISADCDGLKTINDRYGHMVGDEYIRMSVTLMKTNLPSSSVICRMGGDEFLIFLPETDEGKVKEYLQRLEKMAEVFQIYDQKLAVSFGASTITEPSGSFKKAIEESDAEMYRNKQEHKKRR